MSRPDWLGQPEKELPPPALLGDLPGSAIAPGTFIGKSPYQRRWQLIGNWVWSWDG